MEPEAGITDMLNSIAINSMWKARNFKAETTYTCKLYVTYQIYSKVPSILNLISGTHRLEKRLIIFQRLLHRSKQPKLGLCSLVLMQIQSRTNLSDVEFKKHSGIYRCLRPAPVTSYHLITSTMFIKYNSCSEKQAKDFAHMHIWKDYLKLPSKKINFIL